MTVLNIALLGYGKMGKAIEEIAVERGHEILLKIDSHNQDDFNEEMELNKFL
jgi:4-hydroxy-tetrahydrodipicolinate reductase